MNAIIQIKIHWLTKEEGGRNSPPQGPTYAATARFAGEAELFSVVLRWDPALPSLNGQRHSVVHMALLFPDRLPEFTAKLTPGCRLDITEGPRTVAIGEILADFTSTTAKLDLK